MRRPQIERMLPAAYQRAAVDGSVLTALLDVMQELHEPDERILADLPAHLRPDTASEPFLAFLLGWVGMEHLRGPGGPADAGRLLLPATHIRELIAQAASLAQVRGTPAGLRRFLEIATGERGFEIHQPAGRSFHLVVQIPAAARAYTEVIGYLVEKEKPAATTFELTTQETEQP